MDRRGFVRRACGGVLTGTALLASCSAEATPWSPRWSFDSRLLADASLDACCEMAREAGCTRLDLRTRGHAEQALALEEGGFAALCARYGLDPGYSGLFSVGVLSCAPALPLVARAGVTAVSGSLVSVAPSDAAARGAALARVVAGVRPVLLAGARCAPPVELWLECGPKTLLDRPQMISRCAVAVENRALGFMLASELTDSESLAVLIENLGPRVRHVDVGAELSVPGAFDRVLDALRRCAFEGTLSIAPSLLPVSERTAVGLARVMGRVAHSG